MKVLVTLIRKEFWHVIRDSRSLIILVGLPVAMMLIFGFALSNEVKNSKLAIVHAPDDLSRRLIERISQSEYFEVESWINNPSEIDQLFRTNKARLALVFAPDFAKAIEHEGQTTIQVIVNGLDPNTGNMALQYLRSIVADFNEELQGEIDIPYQIEVVSRMFYNPQLESSYTFVPGVMTLILMLLGAMMTSVSIVKEKESGTMEVLLVSPMRPLFLIVSKAMPYFLLCFIDVIIILILAYTVLGMPMRGHLSLLLLMCVVFIFTALSLGLLISSIVSTQQVAMFVSLVGFLMPALVFGGFLFPIDNMPVILQGISHIVPTRWFYEILKNIMIKGLGFEFVYKQALILIGMTLLFMGIAFKNFKIRLE